MGPTPIAGTGSCNRTVSAMSWRRMPPPNPVSWDVSSARINAKFRAWIIRGLPKLVTHWLHGRTSLLCQ